MPSGARHFTGSSKRVEAHPKSSNLVVNSVALSRDLPVFTGFFEIIRVVHLTIKYTSMKRLYKTKTPAVYTECSEILNLIFKKNVR